MEKPKSLDEYAILFMQGKLSEDEYVNKHQANSKKTSWPEAKVIIENKALAFQYMRMFKNPGNRRRALSESMGINAAQLEYLFKSGTTTASDLLRATTRKFDPYLLARYAIVHRSTYSIASAAHISSKWDFHVFDHLGTCTLTRGELLTLLTINNEDLWSINGYILTMNVQDIYLRIEKKNRIILVDLMNPNKSTFDGITSVLLSSNLSWYFLELPSIIIGHMFYIFIGGFAEGDLAGFIKSQFGLRTCYKLTTIYSDFK